jgi:ATP diphosphatase
MAEPLYALSDLLRVMQRLRDPETGCPWDLQQDFRSIVPSTLEECYELAQAIEDDDYPHVADELGDVLFQVIFYAQLGREQALFSFDDIVSNLVEKLLRRHPHVFAQGDIEGVVEGSVSTQEVQQSWETIKKSERASKMQSGALSDVPVALPALPRAQKIQKRASGVNFDWANTHSVLGKLQEELAELQQAMVGESQAEIKDEMGDILFTCVNLARHLGLDAEASLRGATAKFEHRFQLMEDAAFHNGDSLEHLNDGQLDQLWRSAKEGADPD